MAEVNAETINVAATVETSQGADPPPTTAWLNLEPDAVGDPGPDYKKMARTPFTITRQKRRPFVAGVDCTLSLDLDLTKDHIDFFGPSIFKSDFKHSGGTGQSKFKIEAVVDGGGGVDSFTVPALGNLAEGMLVVTRGLGVPANEGLFRVAAGSTGTSVKVPTGLLTAEADPPDNATLDVAGFQFAAGDLEIDVDGNFTTTVASFLTKGLYVGQFGYIPSSLEVDPPYCFTNDDYHGFFEIVAIATNKLTVRRRGWIVGAATAETTTTIRMFFTKWIRNVARSHTDENVVSLAFELTYPGLAPGPADAYEKLRGYMLDQCVFGIPAENKVTMQMTFVGMTAGDADTDRWTGPSAALNPVTGLAVSTSADINRLSVDNIDESGLLTDFKDLKIAFKNNISGAKAVAHMGNRFTPLGVFEADTESEVYLTTPEISKAVGDNRILRLGTGMRNDDFGAFIDIPSTGAMTAKKKIEHNQLITVNTSISGFMDSDSQFTGAMSLFAYLPTLAPGLET